MLLGVKLEVQSDICELKCLSALIMLSRSYVQTLKSIMEKFAWRKKG